MSSPEPIPGRCGARTRSNGYCELYPLKGRTRCKRHGGATPRGKASTAYKHGRYSQHLPDRLADRYQAALKDGDLLAMRDEIALLDTRISELVGRVDRGRAGRHWDDAAKALDDLIGSSAIANKAEREAAAAAAITELRRAIRGGKGDYMVWQEIGGTVEQRRKLVESERRRMVDLQQMITAEKAAVLIGALTDIVTRNVTDPETRKAISSELVQLVST